MIIPLAPFREAAGNPQPHYGCGLQPQGPAKDASVWAAPLTSAVRASVGEIQPAGVSKAGQVMSVGSLGRYPASWPPRLSDGAQTLWDVRRLQG